MLLSNDVLERLFSNIRLKYRHCAIDNLQLINSARAMLACDEILMNHLEWITKTRNVMQRLSLDYSSPAHWDKDKLTLSDLGIISAWKVGRASAEHELNTSKSFQGEKSNFFQFYEDGTTFLMPFGTRKIGLSEINIDFSL